MDLETVVRWVLNESVSASQVADAIDKKYQVELTYKSGGGNEAMGPRVVEIVAYGLTKAGNPVFRAFQPYGDTLSSVPAWKFFRLDRVLKFKPTNRYFSKPASYYYRNIGEFNPNGDETMSTVYKIADFSKEPDKTGGKPKRPDGPRTKETPVYTDPSKFSDAAFRTDTERGMDNLRRQLDNPVYAPGYGPVRKNTAPPSPEQGRDDSEKQQQTPEPRRQQPQRTAERPDGYGPRRKDAPAQSRDSQAPAPDATRKEQEPAPDTLQDLQRLRRQVENPRYVSQDVLDQWRKEQERRGRRQRR